MNLPIAIVDIPSNDEISTQYTKKLHPWKKSTCFPHLMRVPVHTSFETQMSNEAETNKVSADNHAESVEDFIKLFCTLDQSL